MRCPLIQLSTKYPDEQTGVDILPCLQAECAWFNNHGFECAVVTMARSTVDLNDVLGRIADNTKGGWPR